MRRAVFVDKDGTLVEDDPPNVDPARVRFYPDVFRALQLLARAGYDLVVATNQSSVATGCCRETDVRCMQRYVERRMADHGVALAGYYYCPHLAGGVILPYAMACDCRKPRPGLLLRASRDLDIDLTQSWMVGDILHDVEAGRSAGCRTVLLDNGHETEWRLTETRWPHHVAPTLLEAAQLIVHSGERQRKEPISDR